VSETVGQLSRY